MQSRNNSCSITLKNNCIARHKQDFLFCFQQQAVERKKNVFVKRSRSLLFVLINDVMVFPMEDRIMIMMIVIGGGRGGGGGVRARQDRIHTRSHPPQATEKPAPPRQALPGGTCAAKVWLDWTPASRGVWGDSHRR